MKNDISSNFLYIICLYLLCKFFCKRMLLTEQMLLLLKGRQLNPHSRYLILRLNAQSVPRRRKNG